MEEKSPFLPTRSPLAPSTWESDSEKAHVLTPSLTDCTFSFLIREMQVVVPESLVAGRIPLGVVLSELQTNGEWSQC